MMDILSRMDAWKEANQTPEKTSEFLKGNVPEPREQEEEAQ